MLENKAVIAFNFFQTIFNTAVNNAVEMRPYFKSLGFVIFFSYGLFYFLNITFISPSVDESLNLRFVICLLSLFLIMHEYWENYSRVFVAIIFYSTLFLSFSFFFAYMLFKNPDSNIWQINELTGLVLLSLLVDWRTFSFISIAGTLLAFICAKTEPITYYQSLIAVFSSYSAPIICLFILSTKRKNIQQERDNHHEHIQELNQSLELKVEERTKELQKSLSAKTEFLNNISHEIRTPIHGFTVISQGLVSNWNDFSESQRYKYANEIAINAERLCLILNNTLDLSKLTADKMHMNLQDTKLNEILMDIIAECRSLYLKNRNLEIICDIERTYVVSVDAERMKQVFRNLLINAIKFTPEGGEIRIDMKSIDDNIHISIEDNGIGIPEDELEEIFAPFVQSSRTKTGAGGTGLGLSIVNNIIKAHNGKIWAENNQDLGATFHILLPNLS